MRFSNQKVTVVIPTFNEEKTIKGIINDVKPYCDEILVAIAKKSNDRTEKIVRSMGVSYIKDRGFGKGDGMRLAISKINDGIIVFIDADGSHIPADIPLLVKPIIEKKADMVIASRLMGGSLDIIPNKPLETFFRIFFAFLITSIINLRFKKNIQDTQNGFRAIKANVAKKIKLTSNHTEVETEMCIRCFKKGFKIMEVPSRELARKYGDSSIILWKHGFGYVWIVIKNLF